MIASQEFLARREALTQLMGQRGLDAIVVATEANVQYLSRYETTYFGNTSKPFLVILRRDGALTAICHIAEEPSVALDGVDVTVRPYVGPDLQTVDELGFTDYHLPAVRELVAALKAMKVVHVGFELTWHFLPALHPSAFMMLREELDGEVAIEDASPLLWKLRVHKSESEIAILAEAADVCAAGHQAFAERARLGMSERELTSLVRACTYEHGAERIKYTGIVAGIDRAPLGGPTDRVWEPGQVLEVDLCPQVRGYFADFCRIYVGGEPTGAQHAAYAALRDATSRQREAVRPGATVREVSRAAAASLGETPYGRNGHGLGLEMPEPPSLTPLDEGRLAPGMVICLEPNAYFNEVGWLVGEETVVVREDGCELLSPPWPDEIGVIDRR